MTHSNIVLVDMQTIELIQLLDKATGRIGPEAARVDTSNLWRKAFKARDQELLGEEADICLRVAIEAIESIALKRASRFTPAQWLWILRRIPLAYFQGAHVASSNNRRHLAELLSAKGGALGDAMTPGSGGAPISLSSSSAMAILEFVRSAVLLARLHAMFKMCGKGAALTISQNGAPSLQVPEDVQTKIARYQSRHQYWGPMMSGRAGTQLLDFGEEIQEDSLIGAVRLPTPRSITLEAENSPLPSLTEGKYSLQAHWQPAALSLSRLAQVSKKRSPDWWQPEFPYIALLMKLALRISMQGDTGGWWPTLLRTGYVTGDASTFARSFDLSISADSSYMDDIFGAKGHRFSAAEGIEILSNMGNSWPATLGPPIRFSAESVYIDLESCLFNLDSYSLFGPDGGPEANERGTHFERAIQSLIDSSTWVPPPDILRIRGRTLRIGGVALTDIDAIGTNGSRLLLVDAKSYPFSEEYQRGSYRAVHGLENKVRENVKAWESKVEKIRSSPVGDNFDFSRYDELIGIVVTPFSPYLADGDFPSAAPGIPALCSLAELERWLLSEDSR